MVFIDKSLWLKDVFAEVTQFDDVIRQPLEGYAKLTNKEKDQLRQTQVFKGEVIQILGSHKSFALIRKFEQTLGWIPSHHVKPSDLEDFRPPLIESMSPSDFLASWKGIVYEFGGVSKDGIDCSGFTQRYFLSVFGEVLPKNSHDQRKLGTLVGFDDLKDHDLVFCRPLSNLNFHHVAVSYSGQLWHSRRKGGVICQTRDEFLQEFKVEDVKRFRN